MVLAVFAGLNKSYGQTGDGDPTDYVNYIVLPTSGTLFCADAVELACADSADALHPQPGISYTYAITVTTPDPKRILWFVTDTTVIIDSLNLLTDVRDPIDGEYVLTAGGTYNNNTNQTATVDITWKYFSGTDPVLLVAYVEDANGCTDNVEVYRIEPIFNFTLDIASLDGSGQLNADTADCVSPVHSAIYNAGTSELTMDYGENWVFFSVNAANFANSWMPIFQLTYDGGIEDELTLEWAYPTDATADANWNSTTSSGTGTGPLTFTSADSVGVINASGVADKDGECIVVRVRIDHGNNENNQLDGPTHLTFAVNGTMYDAVATDPADYYTNHDLDDLGETAANTPCAQVDFDDSIIYTLTPRPAIESATQHDSSVPTPTPIQQFEPKN